MTEKREKVYADGIIPLSPSDKAPAWVRGQVVISFNKLMKWLNEDGAKYVTEYKGEPQIILDITNSTKHNGVNISVSTYAHDKANGNQGKDNPPF